MWREEEEGSGLERTDGWEALTSNKWVRMEDNGRVDDEGRAVSERVDLMEEFFTIRMRQA